MDMDQWSYAMWNSLDKMGFMVDMDQEAPFMRPDTPRPSSNLGAYSGLVHAGRRRQQRPLSDASNCSRPT